ncbi:MAG: AAA family ATPase [Proteobacteria bacterium]|nr:AAA family ATPase [Pseudomonadota bacterium]
MDFSGNPQLKLAYDFVQYSGCNVFLTGRAGTGKTTFLRNLKMESAKRMVVLAPTGVAAINAGGVTIHSFFQLPFGPQLPSDAQEHSIRLTRFSREKINIIKSLDLLIIDEISMVRADLLDAIDTALRRYRDRYKPFGGVQLLMIGDLQQLAPVVKEDEWDILKNYYDSVFFFSSRALQKTGHVSIELKNIYRQQDEGFIRLLNRVRDNHLDENTLKELNRRYVPGFSPHDQEGYITLTTHNFQAQEKNVSRLNALKGKVRIFKADVNGEFPEMAYPTELELALKVGAQVMFVKNDVSPLKLYYNGKIGTVAVMDEGLVYVKCPDDDETISVSRVEWQNCRYAIDDETKEIKETVIGTFIQYPLKLAWAITIHKSQGLTFEKAIIDAHAAFAHGQVYVALSRCKTLDGMVLSTPISQQSVKSDNTVKHFTRQIEENPPGEEQLEVMKNAYQQSLIIELFDFLPLQQRLGYLLKLLQEHVLRIDARLIGVFKQMDHTLKTEIAGVSNKFMRQVHTLISENQDLENNMPLQVRIKKACLYFAPRIETGILQVLLESEIETDNKTVRKSLHEALERFRAEVFIKKECLKACEQGFRLAAFLKTRATAAISQPIEKKTAKTAEQSVASAHPEFYALLKSWRDKTAESLDLPGHRLLPWRTMREIADKLPATRQALLNIKGIGEKKVKRFGGEILEMTMTFRKKKNMETHLEEPTPPKPRSPAKGDSQNLSFKLFLSGKTVEEIAAERKITATTVEGHLSHFVGTGQLPVGKMVPAEKISRISDYFAKTDNTLIGSAKAALGGDVSYVEINCVLKHIEYLKTKEDD